MTAEHGSERDHVWRGTRRRLSEIDRQRLVERLRDGLARLATLHAALRAAAAAASVEDAGSVRTATGVAEHLDALDGMPGSVPGLLAREAVLDQPTTALELCENAANAQELKANLVTEVVDEAFDLVLVQTGKGLGDNGIWRIAKLNGIPYLPDVGSKTTSFSSAFAGIFDSN